MAEDEREQHLRKKAEKLTSSDLADAAATLSSDEARALIHELQVHQIKLQMQTEELRSAQDQLERSRTKYFDLYDLAPVAYLTLDGDGVILEANLRTAEILGHPRSHLLRRKLRDFVNVSQQAVLTQHLRAVVKTDGRRTCELELVRRDRSTVAVHLETIRISVEEKEASWELRTSITDITERKLAEEELRKSHDTLEARVEERTAELAAARSEVIREKNQLEAVMEALPVGLAIIDERGGLIGSNDMFGKVWGAPRPATQEVNDYTAYQAWWADTGKVVQPEEWASARAVQKGESVIGQMMEIEGFDGVRRFVINSAAPLCDAEGKIVGSAVVIQDISDIRRAEETLQLLAQQRQLALDAARMGWWHYDPVTRTASWDERYKEIFGVTGYESPNDERLKQLHPEDLPGVWAKVEAALDPASLQPYSAEYRINRLDGSMRWIEAHGIALFEGIGKNRRPVGLVGTVADITDRKRAEKASRESEERYRRITEATTDYIFTVRVEDGHPVETIHGPGCEAVTGYTSEEFNSDPYLWIRMVHEADRDVVREQASRILSGDDAQPIEHRIMRKDGSIRWVNNTPVAYYDAQGNLASYDGLIRDITERKRAVEAIARQRAFSDDIINSLPGIFYMSDDKGKLVRSNKRGQEVTGYSFEEASVMDGLDFFTEAHRQRVLSTIKSVFAEGEASTEAHLLLKDGREIPYFFTGRLVTMNDRQYICGVGLDISERKRVEKALKESEARHRTVLEANPDPVVVYDMEGRMIYCNPAFTRVFGWTPEERLGQKMDLVVPEENWPETKIMIDKVLVGENFYGVETQRYTKDGGVIPVSTSAAIYRDEDGRPVGYVVNLRDMRERKMLEAQLLQAQKMEAIGTLAGGVAHDFNNLLQIVRGFTQLLLHGKDPKEPEYRALQKILHASERGAELTRQLLTYSRKVESKRRPIDLNLAVGEVGRLLERSIPKLIEIELHLADELKTVFADPVQLEQMLMNLALNAKDAMADGGRIVIQTENVTLDENYCGTHLEARPGDYALMTFSDTGHGMDEDTLKRAFEPFFSTKEVGKGTGLGLAMVYGIVKNHDGYITCESAPGLGTTFRIYLPVMDQEVESVEPT